MNVIYLWISGDEIHITIKVTTCNLITQRSWTFLREEHTILGVSYILLQGLDICCLKYMYVPKM